MTNHKFIKLGKKVLRKGLQINKFDRKDLFKNYNYVMCHAILNRLTGSVNKTLKISFFSRRLSFSLIKLDFGSMTPDKGTTLKGDSNLLNILKPCYIYT